MSEDDLQRSVIQWFQLCLDPNVIYFAVPNGEHRNIVAAKRLKGQGVMRGVADIILLYSKTALCLEMKIEGGRMSEPQQVFKAKCIYNGIPYVLCHSLDDVIEACQRFAVPMRVNARTTA